MSFWDSGGIVEWFLGKTLIRTLDNKWDVTGAV